MVITPVVGVPCASVTGDAAEGAEAQPTRAASDTPAAVVVINLVSEKPVPAMKSPFVLLYNLLHKLHNNDALVNYVNNLSKMRYFNFSLIIYPNN